MVSPRLFGLQSGRPLQDVAGDECRYCGKKGHWARECRKKKKDAEARTAQVEDDGETTLFVAAAVLHTGTSSTTPEPVHLEEDRLFVQLGDKGSCGAARWIMDRLRCDEPHEWGALGVLRS
jgi:hypothetical protein